MQTVEIKLSLLMDGLHKKEQALSEIASITENQGTVLTSGLSREEVRAFMVQMNMEKQTHIQTVIQCDRLFESLLKEIGPMLDANPDMYQTQIQELQTKIRRVVDLDVKIRVCEDKNNALRNSVEEGIFPSAGSMVKPETPSLTAPASIQEPALQKQAVPASTQEAAPQKRGSKEPAAAPPKQAPLIKNERRIIKAYERNAKIYKG